MPRDAIYGWLGEKAKSLGMPMGWAYAACLTVFAGMGVNLMHDNPRATLYTVLLGAVSGGKSESYRRALKAIRPNPDCVKRTTLGSDKAFAQMFNKGHKKDEPIELRPYVVVQDEMRALMTKCDIQNSALAPTLCQLWYEDAAGSADSKGDHTVNIHLSLLGAMAVADPSDFAVLFGNQTQDGLYTRFLFAPGPPTPWDIDHCWIAEEETPRQPIHVIVPKWCHDRVKEWVRVDRTNDHRPRLGEMALRIAVISASANGDSSITTECLKAALRMADWQVEVRKVYAPGFALNDEARLTAAVLDEMKAAGVDDGGMPRWVNKSKLCTQKNWYRKYSGPMIERVFSALRREDGPLIAQYRQKKTTYNDEMVDDYTKPSGLYRLKGEHDESADDE
jgi:hypothetical protein